jgi:hypothetical protein
MDLASHTTRFADWSRGRARIALALTAALTLGGLWMATTRSLSPVEPQRAGDTDIDLFRKVVEHVHDGATPYDAFDRVFKEYNYPVSSVFNYRTPLHLWMIGQFRSRVWAQALLGALMAATALMTYAILEREGSKLRAGLCVLLMLGAFAYCFITEIYLFAEIWSGTLIALSVCAFGLGRYRLAVAAGLLALFFRELALPYVLSAAAIALWRGRRREAVAWALGVGLYGFYLMFHIWAVVPRLPKTGPLFNGTGWVHFSGLIFILASCRINLLLLASPPWVTALYLPLALVGIVGWRSETGLRIGAVVFLYLAAFSVVGNPFVSYWGLMFAPLLPFGVVMAPTALRDLWSASFSRFETCCYNK